MSNYWICDVQPNRQYDMTIRIGEQNHVAFDVSGTGVSESLEVYYDESLLWPGDLLWPYFGGKNTAPYDMMISLRRPTR